ncbi:YbaN family protein (plasmid) [Sinorhizobium meliloti]|uniref:YbaN family protein n=1 Tax=Sinorhizobium TaxID=28105 RepID=UPI002D777077|nr:YbaN family protein [Sinorhizobium meliloti]WRQ70091.1 YbaN family protein [Sinorhizobium meliloti]
MNLSVRLALLGLAWAMVGLGIAGIFLPLLPTTPFLLLAVWLFSRSSPRLAKWLMDHPLFGPPLRDWQEEGAISRRAKISAILLMSLALIYLWVAFEPPAIALIVVAGIMFTCGAFIVSRPEPPNKR